MPSPIIKIKRTQPSNSRGGKREEEEPSAGVLMNFAIRRVCVFEYWVLHYAAPYFKF